MTQIIINETTPIVVEVSTPGPQGSSGTATVGTVTTGAAGSAAAVTNSGTPSAAVFNFTIPRGDVGDVTPAATAAKNAAEAAATAAGASATAAQSSSTSASASATAAQSSATSASASAATATTKAQEASTSAANAAASAQSVSTAATTATTKAAEAAASATAALSSANTATAKAQEAAGSATTADTKAQEAVVSATTATNKAAEASASAATALSAQQVTTDNATLAIAQANIASAKAAAANTSANDALVQASVATTQAGIATTQAATATTQAGIATTQAGIATTQATTATNQANTATAQATVASTKASEALASASNSQASATAAATAQTSASASASTATAQATAATTAKTAAETARDAAIVAQNNAVAVVTGGTATLTPSAGKIPLSDAQGKIAKGWLTSTDLVEQTDIGTAPNEIPLNQFLGELAYMNAQNIPTLGISVANAATANVTNLMQVTEISNAVPSLNLDFAKVKQLDPRITFTRASTGTYYDGKTVAKAEENLLTWSQAFDNAVWVKDKTAVVANSAIAPDGTINADTLKADAGTSITPYITQINENGVAQASYVYSLFAKAGTYSFIQLRNNSGAFWHANFNVTAGAGAVGTSNNCTASIQDVGGGWYRCVVVFAPSISNYGAALVMVASASAANFQAWSPAGTETVFIWGAQLEQRASATAYTPTTTQPVTTYIPVLLTAASGVPRFEHNPVTGESLGLEIEEQRTNLITYSEQFDNAAWTKSNTTVTANTIVAPDGTLTGDKVVESNSTSRHEITLASAIAGATAGATYTLSLFAKAAGRSYVEVFFATGEITNNPYAIFDLANGTVSYSSGATASIISTGNGFYRCSITAIPLSTTITPFLGIVNTASTARLNSYTGDGFSGIYIWGAQLEAGAFPTSYIPTTTAQVTRAADAASMTGANFSSWFNQGPGSFFVDYATVYQSAAYKTVATLTDGSNNYMQFRSFSASGSTMGANNQIVSAGSLVADFVIGSAASPFALKVGLAYATNDFASVANGGTVLTDTLGAVPVGLNAMNILGGQFQNGSTTIRKITYYPQRLSNAELVEITA